MAIVDDDIERVREANSIVDVVQQYVALRRVGRNFVGLCPFHAERSGSFNVREETGRYKCFGCGAGGDVFRFVQEIEHIDFVGAVERLAGRAGIQLTYTSGGEGRDRQRRKGLIEVMAKAVDWYHERLLTSPDARAARDYLRGRGLSGDIARTFRIGWAPDGWDALATAIGVPAELLRDAGLAFTNRSGRTQDSFRARIMFPIFNEMGDAVGFGGRILPGSTDPAKYKNSPETAVYTKSKVLYGLNWAKADIVARDEVIVCEGYTDVIGFHRAGIPRAVATCGTALTEEHVRLLKRFAKRVVLAFDADAAGQGAAERFYEWEQRHQVQVSVAQMPEGTDPGDLATSDPERLRRAVDEALPFLGFRVQRVLGSTQVRSPEDRSRLATRAIGVVNEHPDRNVRKLYAAQIATHVGLPAADLVALADERSVRPVTAPEPNRRIGATENAEFVAVVLLVHRWDDIAPWLDERLFVDDLVRRAFVALAATDGDLDAAMSHIDPEAREVLERAAVADIDADPEVEARTLIAAAVRRELARPIDMSDPRALQDHRDARLALEQLDDRQAGPASAEWLLGWFGSRGGGAE
jgi:DNA primase